MECRRRARTSLEVSHPHLIEEWHPEKNGTETLADFSRGSDKKVWWRCSNRHEWAAVISSRVGGNGCPFCSGKAPSQGYNLASDNPDLCKEWHPKNTLTPADVTPRSDKTVWWTCERGHEWEAKVIDRNGSKKNGCPYCSNKRVGADNCLAATHPDVAREWHPERNEFTTTQVGAGSNKRAWWRCADGHEWAAVIHSRTLRGAGCPFCSGRRASAATSLAAVNAKLAAEWHPTKNKAAADSVTPGSNQRVWWQCADGHEWQATVSSRSSGNGCAMCSGRKPSPQNNLAVTHPHLAREWHPKNPFGPAHVTSGSGKGVWWRCSVGHEFRATICNRAGASGGCPFCSGRQATADRNLAVLFPELAAEWHPSNPMSADEVTPGSGAKVRWRCSEGHSWNAVVGQRTAAGTGCPYCAGNLASEKKNLAVVNPALAAEWHPTKNGALTPRQVTPQAHGKYWWRCAAGHEWETSVAHRARGHGCPGCSSRWTVEKAREFVRSLLPHLPSLSQAEFYKIAEAGGALASNGEGGVIVRNILDGRFPHDDVRNFAEGGLPPVVESPDGSCPDAENPAPQEELPSDVEPPLDVEASPSSAALGDDLPSASPTELLLALGSAARVCADKETIDFLVAKKEHQLWQAVMESGHEADVVAEVRALVSDDAYVKAFQTTFLANYDAAKSLRIPKGYSFKPRRARNVAPPNLMQRLVAVLVRDRKRVANWSGTGRGKTNSAILASRVIDANLTVVTCPNAVIPTWVRAITKMFPDSVIQTKTFEPRWGRAKKHRYLVLNYEMFQQPDSAERVRGFVERESPSFVVVDEIQAVKQRAENVSKRREVVLSMLTQAAEQDADLHVLGMSATPIINNLTEGKALIEMISGKRHDDLGTTATVVNCMKMHSRFTALGPRWISASNATLTEVPIDCCEYLDEVRSCIRGGGSTLELEEILTKARLPAILEHLEPKTIVYSHNIGGNERVDRQLREAIEAAGYRVGFFTGESKVDLEKDFIDGPLDVLVVSSAIALGVDGLQQVCRKLIFNVLPWTAAEFDQIVARVDRQGQTRPVEIVVPVTHADVNGQEWSWCRGKKLAYIRYKRTVADAAIDGIVPAGQLRSPEQAVRDLRRWLERLEEGQVVHIDRPDLVVALPDSDPEARRRVTLSELSRMNKTWAKAPSAQTHARLRTNPDEWRRYHELRTAAEASWPIVPWKEFVTWARDEEPGMLIGDLGCGLAHVREALLGQHTVHSFDHVAVNEHVVACDISKLPLDDDSLDVALFSLSLQGSNFADYLYEAHRCLRKHGWLHVYEPLSWFDETNPGPNIEGFKNALKELGYGHLEHVVLDRFVGIRGLKVRKKARPGIELVFRQDTVSSVA